MSSFVRKDLRDLHQLRPFSINLGGLTEYDGSCQFSQGQSSVLTTVQGPGAPRYARHDNVEKFSIEIELNIPNKMNSNAVGASSSSTSSLSSSSLVSSTLKNEEFVENYLLSLLQNMINVYVYRKKLIIIKVLILSDSGAILSTILNSVTLALLDAGVELNYYPVSFDLALLKSCRSSGGIQDSSDLSSQWLLDPTLEEDAQAPCLVSASVISTNSFFQNFNRDQDIEQTKQDVQFLKLELFGTCADQMLLDAAMAVVEKNVQQVENIMRDTLNKKSMTNNI